MAYRRKLYEADRKKWLDNGGESGASISDEEQKRMQDAAVEHFAALFAE